MGQEVLGVGEVIAGLSGKGGTGKTSVCAGIATALAQDGNSVLCIDCDVGLRNLDISLGLADTAPLTFLDVCDGRQSLKDLPAHPLFPTLRFLTAPSNRTIEQIDAAFTETLSYAKLQDLPEFTASCQRLSTLLKNLADAHGLTIWNVI